MNLSENDNTPLQRRMFMIATIYTSSSTNGNPEDTYEPLSLIVGKYN